MRLRLWKLSLRRQQPAPTSIPTMPVEKKVIPAELIILFILLLVLGLAVRVCPIFAESQLRATYGRYFFVDDDSWWHQHLIDQILQYGQRLDPDPMSWAPEGRPMTHPPGYHFLIAYVSKLFPIPAYDTAFWFVAVSGTLCIIAWFLLSREIFGTFGGFLSAFLYAVTPITVSKTIVGKSRPPTITEAFLILGLWLFLYIQRTEKKSYWMVLPGIVMGISALFWEGTLYFYITLILAYWIASILFKQATRQTHLLCLTTLIVSMAVALTWYGPIFLRFGLDPHANTPPNVLKNTLFYQTEGIAELTLFGGNFSLIGALITYPILVFRALKDKQKLMKNFFGLTWMTLGLAAFLMGFGRRFVDILFILGIIMVFVYGVKTIWDKTSSWRPRIAILLGVLIITNAYITATGLVQMRIFYEADVEMTKAIGVEIPANSIILSWWSEGGFLAGAGEKNVFDLYLQWVPSWAKTRDIQVATFYLTENETEALAILKNFNATYVLVNVLYCYPYIFKQILDSKGINAKPEEYFWFYKTATGSLGEFGPTEKGRGTLLARLVCNTQTGNILKQWPMPQPPSDHFQLVWKNQNSEIMVYKVIQ